MARRRGIFGRFIHELTKPIQPDQIVKNRRKAKKDAAKKRASVNARAQKQILDEAAREVRGEALAAQRERNAAAKKAAPARTRPAPARRPTRDDLAVRRTTPPAPLFRGAQGAAPAVREPAWTDMRPGPDREREKAAWFREKYGTRDDDPSMFTQDASGFDWHTASVPEQQARLRSVGLCGSTATRSGDPCLNRSTGVCAAGHRMPKGGR